MRRRCNVLILLSLIFRPAALCWWTRKNNNSNNYTTIKITNEFRNLSVTLLRPQQESAEASAGMHMP